MRGHGCQQDMTYTAVKCPTVGGVIFVPRERSQNSTWYAVPGMMAGPPPADKKLRTQFVQIEWIRNYAEKVGRPVKWETVWLWRQSARLCDGIRNQARGIPDGY